MPTRQDLQEIAEKRLLEANILSDNGLYDGAAYLLGYVVELGLKAIICKVLDCDYPDTGEISKSFLTHKLSILIRLTGLENKLIADRQQNPQLDNNWVSFEALEWNESVRYYRVGSISENIVQNAVRAVGDSTNGVLFWIKTQW